jgi:hypothetical protein
MGLASCDPTVNDLDRVVDPPLPCRGVDMSFWGDRANGAGAEPRPLTGDEAIVVAAFCKLGGTLGTSSECGCNGAEADWWDRLDELLDAFRRPSAPCPATNETSRGDEGWDTRLGDEFEWLYPDGDCGLFPALAFEIVRCRCVDKTGLPSRDGAGEVMLATPPGLMEAGLLWEAIASALSFWITSLFAFSRTGRFLKLKDPKSSAATGSLNLLDFKSRTCGGMCSGISLRFIELT